MDILKAFVLNGIEHNVTILWEKEKPLFRASEIAKILDIKNIRTSITDFDSDEKVVRKTATLGGPQETLFLTETGTYRLLMHSKKPIARPFQKWVNEILVSIRETGKYELQVKLREAEENFKIKSQEEIALALEKAAEKHKADLAKAEHNALVEAFKDRYVVYFGKICEKDNKSLIKIGSTKQIQIRVRDLIKEFKSFTIFKVFESPRNEMFEKFLHHHPMIVKYKYVEPLYDNHCSNGEVFHVTDSEIEDIIRIAVHNKFKFSNVVEAEQVLELEKLKLEQLEKKAEIAINMKNTEIIGNSFRSETYIDPVILFLNNRKHTQVKGNKIQRYSKDGKELLETYDSYAFAIRDSKLGDLSRNGIKTAIKTNTIYKTFRWAELNRLLPDDTVQELKDTILSKTVNIGYVAMLNLEKTKIVEVFSDQKTASANRQFANGAALSKAIRVGSKSGGHFFRMWKDCSKELQDEYLSRMELPQKRSVVNGKQIEQLHPITNTVLKTYSSVEDVIKEFQISRITLQNACIYNIITKGYKWRFLT
jgi:prophage antirepressor-like protein